MASIKHLVDIDLNKNQLTNVKLQHISGNPSGTGEDYEGRIFYDSSAQKVKFHNGSTFAALGTSDATGDITAVTAGDGLTGGGSSGDVTLAVGVDDSSIEINSDALRVKASGITNAMLAGSIASSKLAGSIADSKLSTITTANKVGLAALDIDGGTDIGAALADADLMIVDDGAGGTNRKATMSRLKTYMQNNLTFTTNTNTVDMGDGFVIEDADGTEVTITENKEIKFTGTGGLTINFTDVSTGSDGDPFDLEFAIGTLNQDTTGNAATATALETARNIGGVSFDGTGNIDLPGVNTSGSQDTSGNAATATKLATARSFTTSGDVVVASTNFDGSANFTAAATIQANAVEGSMLNDNVISGLDDINAAIASTDEILISDNGSLRRSDVSRLTTFLQDALTFTTNTDVDVSVANLKSALGDGFPSNTVTIGDSNDTVTIGNDLVVTGDLTVSGDTTTVNTATLSVEDPLIILANGNTGDAVDFGFYGKYVESSTTKFAGLFRDQSESGDVFTFFDKLEEEPGTTVDTGGSGFDFADVKAGKFISVDGFSGNLVGNVTGNVTGDTSGSAGTVTSIGNLTGDVTSSNRATTIANNAVTTAKINADAVTGAKIADNAIDSEHYTDGSIDTAHIGDDQVTYAKIQNVSATNVVLGRDSSGAGVIEEISASSLRTILNVENGATADQTKSDIDGLAITTVGTLDTGNATAIVDAASLTAAGISERATTDEAKAGTDSTRHVTPAGLAARSFTTAIGGATSVAVTHSLGTRAVNVQLFDTSSYETVIAQVVRTDTDTVTVSFNTAPSEGDVTIVVTKTQ